jgi:hypothetical protein
MKMWRIPLISAIVLAALNMYLCMYNTFTFILRLFFLISVDNCDQLIPVQGGMTCDYKYDSRALLTEGVGLQFFVASGNITSCESNPRIISSPSVQFVSLPLCAFPFCHR